MQFEVYAAGKGDWRWRFVTRNGRIAATSPESYSTAAEARQSLDSTKQALAQLIESMDD